MSQSADPKKSILVVDDEYINLVVIKECLNDLFDLEFVEDGISCLEAVERKSPDLILLDVRMPIMDGLEVCKRLKSDPKTQNIPIICLSALSMTYQIEEGLKAGADAYINKPFNEVDLMEKLSEFLD